MLPRAPKRKTADVVELEDMAQRGGKVATAAFYPPGGLVTKKPLTCGKGRIKSGNASLRQNFW
jgi:hypothetical protein